jgi:apolipoprotein N-acyltransferase
VVRQANAGTSIASDSRGTVLARQDYFMTEDRMMLADVPTEGVRTVYGCLGDWFAWTSIAGFALLLLFALRRKPRRNQS